MILHRLRLNPRHPVTMRHLRLPYQFHGVLMRATSGSMYGESGNGRTLFRIEPTNQDEPQTWVDIIFQTDGPLLHPEIFNQYGEKDKTYQLLSRELSSNLFWCAEGIDVRFRLQFNPIRRKSITINGKERINVRPIVIEEEAKNWIVERLEKSGFSPIDIDVQKKNIVRGKGKREVLNSFLAEGLLKIEDSEKVKECIKSGIGRAKIHGFGLMTLAKSI